MTREQPSGFVYNFFTENPNVIRDMALEASPRASRIVTVCASGWPILFQEIFADAEVYTFDKNPKQLLKFQNRVTEVTGNRPVFATLGRVSFEEYLSKIKDEKGAIDVLFISNIPDYLNRAQLNEFVELISELEVNSVLFSALGEGYRNQSVLGNGELLAELLEEEGYAVSAVMDGNYEVKLYFKAVISEEST